MVYKNSISVPNSELPYNIGVGTGLFRSRASRSESLLPFLRLTSWKKCLRSANCGSTLSTVSLAPRLQHTVPNGSHRVMLSLYREHWYYPEYHRPNTSNMVATSKAFFADKAQFPLLFGVVFLFDGREILALRRKYRHHTVDSCSHTIISMAIDQIVSGPDLARGRSFYSDRVDTVRGDGVRDDS